MAAPPAAAAPVEDAGFWTDFAARLWVYDWFLFETFEGIHMIHRIHSDTRQESALESKGCKSCLPQTISDVRFFLKLQEDGCCCLRGETPMQEPWTADFGSAAKVKMSRFCGHTGWP